MRILPIAFACGALLAGTGSAETRRLTLPEAHQIALQKHPRIGVARLLALAGWQGVVEARSAFFPSILGNLAAVGTDRENLRSVSTSLPVSAIVDRGGAAVFVNQLITDFGRTANLTASARLKAKSQDQNLDATRAQVLLEVDNAYLSALRAQAIRRVAAVTVKERQLQLRQIKALEANELRSTLDVSFADVTAQQAELLLSHAENDLSSAYTTLATLLDEPETTSFYLVDDEDDDPKAGDVTELIADAYRARPDLLRLRLEVESLHRLARAEGALRFPTVSVQGTAGELPYHDDTTNPEYAAAGVIVSVPLFAGGLYMARHQEAELKARAADESLHDATNNVARDVRIAWFSANNARKNLGLTSNLRERAKRSLDLAQARFNAGSTGILELSQAQLAFTSAEIDEASARYEYRLRRSILQYQVGSLK